MRLKEICQKTGLSRDTLRYYERQGLLKPNHEAYAREYSAKDLERIEEIKALKKLDFQLKEIKVLTDFDDIYQDLESIENMDPSHQAMLLDLLSYKIETIKDQLIDLRQGLDKLSQMRAKIQSLNKPNKTS